MHVDNTVADRARPAPRADDPGALRGDGVWPIFSVRLVARVTAIDGVPCPPRARHEEIVEPMRAD
ncbi:hypothetical protein [Embleya sp. NPDC001921]